MSESPPPPPPPLTEDARKTLLGKRFAAALIDFLVCVVLLALLGGLSQRLGAFICALYILGKDGLSLPFMKGRSLGKHFLKIQPVPLSGGSMDLQTSALRNWPMALPSLFVVISGGFIYFILSIIGFIAVVGEIALSLTQANGRRFGDQLADTEVR